MAVRELRDYLENGNISHSVNYPNMNNGKCTDASRITICHKNQADMIRQFARILSDSGMNITNMSNKSKGEFAYTMIDLSTEISQATMTKINSVEGVYRARIIK